MGSQISANYPLNAPVDGLVVSIQNVPDPVFASQTLGSGIAIEPLGDTLCAPADGKVIQCAATRHAVTLELAQGVELLLHLGLDTVNLNGEGLTLLVREGDTVTAGTPLIRFDIDTVASKATSLITPIVSIGENPLQLVARTRGRVAMGEPFAELAPVTEKAAAGAVPANSATTTVEKTVRLALENGLHARPASKLKAIGDKYHVQILLRHKDREAPASRITALLNLGLMHEDTVTLVVSGAQAELAASEAGIFLETPEGIEPVATVQKPEKQQDLAKGILHGVVASQGYAVGVLQHFTAALPDIAEQGKGAETEKEQFLQAMRTLQTRLENAAQASRHGSQAEILAAHHALLDDDELIVNTLVRIQAGKSAAFAWKTTLDGRIATLARSANPLIRERTADLRDLQLQLVNLLLGDKAKTPEINPALKDAIVVADDLTPSQMIALATVKPAGICLAAGGVTSHVAILCRSAGIPCLMGLGAHIIDSTLFDGRTVILDADTGMLELKADEKRIMQAQKHIGEQHKKLEKAQAEAHKPAKTKDGAHILVAANIASGIEAENGFAQGADAVGLFRSEFLFLDRNDAPSAREQQAQYQAAIDAMQGKPVVIRTLDIGADKQLSWLKISDCPNPALGIRGVRLVTTNPELMETQLTALLQVKAQTLKGGKSALQIMLPMVSDPDDFAAVRGMMDRLARKLKLDKDKDFVMPQLGAMIEVPSAALMTETLAKTADFFSIGTNDLTQYTLAMDREESKLGARLDVLHPAVLRLIAFCCEGAARHKRPVAVCGAAAGDEIAGLALAALGVDELSMEPQRIAATKERLRKTDLRALRKQVDKALLLDNGAQVRAALGAWLKTHRIWE
ncbi:MAG: Phosphoenolpyruvate-protein phosphotransferase [Candidatus Tokpelaia hoelldobleri]|uniref:phosphoenolpyruvate--protein phosphotransferase n=1 Tax=Candidatus Tokpelaia hoelldobleri TaxID=1902579 RepID=A0A1U9JV81_9HYPH|nr:MAG: Phosphoenolpyruvate-protein phosphotransferase [Candidatus Tokpelaia hoelldoblerii]